MGWALTKRVNILQGIEEKFTNPFDNLFVTIRVKTQGDELLIRKNMKAKNYVMLGVFFLCTLLQGYSQCDVTAKTDTTISCGAAVQLDIEATGGTPDVISWTPSTGLSATTIANPIANPTSTTKYYVTITTGTCTATDSVTITVTPLMTDAGNDKALICGGSVQLDTVKSNYTGSGSLTYSWSPATGLNSASSAYPVATITQPTKYYVTITTPNGCTAIDSVMVNVNAFIADAGNDKTLICGGSAQLDAVTSNYTGTGNLTYSWTPITGLSSATISNPVATVKQATKYYVTVTTPNGCISTDSVMVNVDPFKANAGNDKILSCGNTVQFDQVSSNYTGSGSLTYSWSPATGLNATNIFNPTATIKQTTTYTVTVNTPNGCTSTDSITVFVGPLSVDAGPNRTIVCGGNTTLGITTNYNGSGALTYAWTPSTGLDLSYIAYPTASPVQTTKYYINITTPNGCTAKDSVTVIVNALTANAGADRILVCGGEAQLDVQTNYSGTGSPNYSWSPTTGLNLSNVANPTASVTQNTIFMVTVTTQNGCVAKDTVNVIVTPLTADAGPDITMTCGSEAQLLVKSNYTGSQSLNYSWTPASGLNLSNIANPVASVNQTTTFYATVKSVNGCKAVDTVIVNVNPLTVNAGSDKAHLCGGSVQLDSALTNYNGNAQLTYIWLPKAGLNNASIPNPISNSPGTTYTLTITTPFGACQAKDQVTVSIAPLGTPEICIVTVDTSNKNLITWVKDEIPLLDSFLIYKETKTAGTYAKIGSLPKTAAMIFKDVTSKPNSGSNRYKISIKDTCGVETLLSAAHKTMYLSVTKGSGVAWNLTWENYEGFPVSSYIIYRGTTTKDLQFLDAVSGSVTQYTDSNPPNGDVYYQLEITRPTACSPTSQFNASRSNIAASNGVGINELTNGFRFTVYPNPATDLIYVNLENNVSKNMTVHIYNTLGALVKTVNIDQSNLQLNVSDLSNGFYTLELRINNSSSKQKLTIQK